MALIPLPALINGVRYSWTNIRMVILSRMVTGVEEINYEDNTNNSNVYGAGNKPVARTIGKYEAKGSIKLSDYEMQAIANLLQPGQTLGDIIPFPISVSYEDQNGVLVTHTLNNAQFTKNARNMKSQDVSISANLDLVLGDIAWS